MDVIRHDDIMSAPKRIMSNIERKNSIMFISVYDTDFITYKFEDSFDRGYCEQHNIMVIDFPAGGGTLVCRKGDIGIALILPKNLKVNVIRMMTDGIVRFLKIKESNATIATDNNDILVDGRKCAGLASANHGDMTYYAMHISMSVDLDAIRKICTKPMVKVPMGLSEAGIRQEEIEKYVEFMLHQIAEAVESSQRQV